MDINQKIREQEEQAHQQAQQMISMAVSTVYNTMMVKLVENMVEQIVEEYRAANFSNTDERIVKDLTKVLEQVELLMRSVPRAVDNVFNKAIVVPKVTV